MDRDNYCPECGMEIGHDGWCPDCGDGLSSDAYDDEGCNGPIGCEPDEVES